MPSQKNRLDSMRRLPGCRHRPGILLFYLLHADHPAGHNRPGTRPEGFRHHFFLDMRAPGKGFDRYYERAREVNRVRYIRSLVSRVTQDPRTQNLEIT